MKKQGDGMKFFESRCHFPVSARGNGLEGPDCFMGLVFKHGRDLLDCIKIHNCLI